MRHRKALKHHLGNRAGCGEGQETPKGVLEKDRQDNHSSGSTTARQHRDSVMPVR